jgi:hypothetical protein
MNGETKLDNPCLKCNEMVNKLEWSPNGGVSCNDNQPCTYDDTCSSTVAGQCVGLQYSCTAPSSINTCAKGVCHGGGPSDCTYEMKEGWTGCFMISNPNDPDTGVCAATGANNPVNECQTCNAADNEWQNKTNDTKCGDAAICRACNIQENGVSMCVTVDANTDPNNDCTQNCQVCDGNGSCTWATEATNPEGDCVASDISTCGYNGSCSGSDSSCAYWTGGSGQGSVNDGEECTTPDYCDGNGGTTGTPKADGTLCAANSKICKSGVCQACHSTSNPCPSGYVCDNGQCYVGTCTISDVSACPTGICKSRVCNNHQCGLTNDDNLTCTDGKTCTTDVCSGGSCQSTINAGKCLIGGICRYEGEILAGSECYACVPGTSTVNWSLDHAECNDSTSCSTDYCLNGICYNDLNHNLCPADTACRNYSCVSPGGCLYTNINETGYCPGSSGDGYCTNGNCTDRYQSWSCIRPSSGTAFTCAMDKQRRLLFYISGTATGCENLLKTFDECLAVCDDLERRNASGTLFSDWRMIGDEFWGTISPVSRDECGGVANIYIDAAWEKAVAGRYWLRGCDETSCGTYDYQTRTASNRSPAETHYCMCVHNY